MAKANHNQEANPCPPLSSLDAHLSALISETANPCPRISSLDAHLSALVSKPGGEDLVSVSELFLRFPDLAPDLGLGDLFAEGLDEELGGGGHEADLVQAPRDAYDRLPWVSPARGARDGDAQRDLVSESGSADRISGLPANALLNIFSCLEAKDVARTAVLSRSWRETWRSLMRALRKNLKLPICRYPQLVDLALYNSPSSIFADQGLLNPHGRRGLNPHGREGITCRERFAFLDIPRPPLVSVDTRFSELVSESDGVDRISGLPDAVLSKIISRLEMKEAARTAVLSRRWRPIWRSTPLVLVDLCLFPAEVDSRKSPHHYLFAVYNLVSYILAAHPGPVKCVYLGTLVYPLLKKRDELLNRWLNLLSIKGVEEVVLVNNYWRKPLPSNIFGLGNLTRLHLALWRFPDTAALPPGVVFPSLRELGLSDVFINNMDLDFLLSRSRKLEILNCSGNLAPLCLQLVSHSLRCLQIQGSNVVDIAVVDAPRLERLILPGNWAHTHCRVQIEHAPELCIFGCFEPGKHELQIGNTVIKVGMLVNSSAMVPSVKILALQVWLGVNNDVKRLPSYLRCFPNIESLHIQSLNSTEPTMKRKRTLKIWQKVGDIECVKSQVRLIVFNDFKGYACEISFLKFFVKRAQKLETMVIVVANGCFSSPSEVQSKLKPLLSSKSATTSYLLKVCFPNYKGAGPWELRSGSDLLNNDPFLFSAGQVSKTEVVRASWMPRSPGRACQVSDPITSRTKSNTWGRCLVPKRQHTNRPKQ